MIRTKNKHQDSYVHYRMISLHLFKRNDFRGTFFFFIFPQKSGKWRHLFCCQKKTLSKKQFLRKPKYHTQDLWNPHRVIFSDLWAFFVVAVFGLFSDRLNISTLIFFRTYLATFMVQKIISNNYKFCWIKKVFLFVNKKLQTNFKAIFLHDIGWPNTFFLIK